MNKKELFLISITIFLTIIAWMLLEAYKVESAIKTEKEEMLTIRKIINLDTKVLKTLKAKKTP